MLVYDIQHNYVSIYDCLSLCTAGKNKFLRFAHPPLFEGVACFVENNVTGILCCTCLPWLSPWNVPLFFSSIWKLKREREKQSIIIFSYLKQSGSSTLERNYRDIWLKWQMYAFNHILFVYRFSPVFGNKSLLYNMFFKTYNKIKLYVSRHEHIYNIVNKN